jgi:hypothetical protein
MEEIPKNDKLFLMLHRAGWSIGDTAFVGKEGMSWLVFGTKGDQLDPCRRKEPGRGLETGLPPG